jgi:hypothetical protein
MESNKDTLYGSSIDHFLFSRVANMVTQEESKMCMCPAFEPVKCPKKLTSGNPGWIKAQDEAEVTV